MKYPRIQRRTFALMAVIIPLLVLFIYVAVQSGPLAPVSVTLITVESKSITPALSGIGSVQARYTYKIGPTHAGRIKTLDVHVGDTVSAGQVLGKMDPVDLDSRIRAQWASIKSAEANLRQAEVTQAFTQTQAARYDQLLTAHATSEESATIKRQEHVLAQAAYDATHHEVKRLYAELDALNAQRDSLNLISPVSGRITARHADPGTTIVAGQAIIEIIDPNSLWIDARFDQINAQGLAPGLPAQIVLRSTQDKNRLGQVLRIEPLADMVTEEMRARILFDVSPSSHTPMGELAEVTVQLPELPMAPTIPNAAIHTYNGKRGVWKLASGKLTFLPVVFGRSDLNGQVQVKEGLAASDQLVMYSEKPLHAHNRIRVVEHLSMVAP